ncbi:hypothetical protein [Spirosoma linguale]|uniref:Uncharacterized protein n=1 Tax=Spirosoma linguale (strain ATCC 33905 / DSM 74 / LMG 10896 / Claus 1) TaxID=504472 RepID=D2QC55_SPILD|nr:hypothetical protein Slin_3795 [Spirosoma linguale DSM 74]
MSTTNQSAQALLASVLRATQNGVLVYQAIRTGGLITDLRLTILNAVAQRDFNKPATDLVGQLCSWLYPVKVKATLFDHYCQIIQTGESARFEYQYQLAAQTTTD